MIGNENSLMALKPALGELDLKLQSTYPEEKKRLLPRSKCCIEFSNYVADL